jgi:hypothetical protein
MPALRWETKRFMKKEKGPLAAAEAGPFGLSSFFVLLIPERIDIHHIAVGWCSLAMTFVRHELGVVLCLQFFFRKLFLVFITHKRTSIKSTITLYAHRLIDPLKTFLERNSRAKFS